MDALRSIAEALRDVTLAPLSFAGRVVVPDGGDGTPRRILCADLTRAGLRTTILECRGQLPFDLDSILLLSDHFDAILTSPSGDVDDSKGIGIIEKRFTSRPDESGSVTKVN
ncbi:hypothetical protein G3480_03630 [Thiorhodococcus mannitoliphagus]|uniref:Uncharacterized protein n=1 Tax=Thiorhodococcus mannitoliphagus TaxID=329406 RepID=A0A6P1DUP0_9GAMM|nr:hypothetical protein [Thiorhodococcus mannitoliphagus]NEX19414.1 hypothetical protein [Thiorhodococcus mannitoliphagus]